MYKFSNSSIEKLGTCDPRIQQLCMEAIKIIDFTVIEGHRNEALQNYYYSRGLSKLKWPDGKHNRTPSLAFDAVPYPIDWHDQRRFYYMAGVFKAVASNLGFAIRHGGDWDGDNDFSDQNFIDLAHFEIVGVL